MRMYILIGFFAFLFSHCSAEPPIKQLPTFSENHPTLAYLIIPGTAGAFIAAFASTAFILLAKKYPQAAIALFITAALLGGTATGIVVNILYRFPDITAKAIIVAGLSKKLINDLAELPVNPEQTTPESKKTEAPLTGVTGFFKRSTNKIKRAFKVVGFLLNVNKQVSS